MSKRDYTGEILGRSLALGAGWYYQNRRAVSSTQTQTRRRQMNIGPGSFSSRSRRRIGRKRRASARVALNRVIGTGGENIYRWQNTSQTVLGPGKLNIGWNTDGAYQLLPVHFMSLTTVPDAPENVGKGCRNQGMHTVYYKPDDGSMYFRALPCSSPNGTLLSSGNWAIEKQSHMVDPQSFSSAFHKWTSIKLNLYGTYSVPITYSVYLCTMKESLDPLAFSSSGPIALGSECCNFLRDLTRPLLYSNVGLNAKQEWPRDVRVIKSQKITIQPLSYSDQQAEEFVPETYSKAPHIHMLKWFIRHDRMREYGWSKTPGDALAPDLSFNNQGWDQHYTEDNYCDVEWGKRVFLILTATAPNLRAIPTPDAPYATTTTCQLHGSYDVCVRNCYRLFY